jgi:thiamine transport system permease protein
MDKRHRLNRLPHATTIAAAAAMFLIVAVGYPVAQILRRGIRPSVIGEVFATPRIRQVLWFTTWQAALSTVAVLAIAIPVAILFGLYQFRGRRIFLAGLAAPFTLPTVVVGNAFLSTLPTANRQGVFAILCAHTFFNVGMAIRMLTQIIERLDPQLENAAATLGASPIQSALTIIGPQIRHALITVAGLVFTLSFTSYGVVLILGGPTRSTVDVEIRRQALSLGRTDRGAVLAITQILFIAAVLWVTSRALGHRNTSLHSTTNFNANIPDDAVAIASRRSLQSARGWRARTVLAFALFIPTALVVIPIAQFCRRAFQNPTGDMGLENFRALKRVTPGSGFINAPLHALTVSLRTATFATIVAVVVGCACALGAHYGNRRASRMLKTVASTLPLSISAVVFGLGYLIAFAKAPIAWRSSWFAVPAAQAVVALPFVTRAILPTLEALPQRYREASSTLGASPWRTVIFIDLRLCGAALRTAVAYAFAISLGEFGAATFLARPSNSTLPIAIAQLSSRPGVVLRGQAAALSVILGALTISVMFLGTAESRSSRRSHQSPKKWHHA